MLDVVMARQAAHVDLVAGVTDVGQITDATHVDEHRGRGEPQLHERQQRVSAGEHLRLVTVLAAQADGRAVTTIEGLAQSAEQMHPMQQAFQENHGLQCGFCTPGMVMAAVSLLKEHPNPTEAEVREGLEGNLCRCTGYHNIVAAVLAAAGSST